MLNYDIKSNLFSAVLVDSIASKQGQTVSDFDISAGLRVSDEIASVFSRARNQWANFQESKSRLEERKTGVSETRSGWMLPLFAYLGFDLSIARKEQIGDRAFTISHRDDKRAGFPIHVCSFRQDLDKNLNKERGNRQSPHVQMQEYLNHTEHLYGIITNGHYVRLLRDHHRLTGIQYMQWDLKQIMEDNDLASFSILFRMLHASRVSKTIGGDSLLERYHQESVEEGHRVRDKLKKAVGEALSLLGNGFLVHKANDALRNAIEERSLKPVEYGRDIRQLVYRFLFLMVAEDRGLIHNQQATTSQRALYREHYSLSRFRSLAERHYSVNEAHYDLWEQLKTTFSLFEEDGRGTDLGISALGGDLFDPKQLEFLKASKLSNRHILKALDLLSRFEKDRGQRIRINYTRIGVEEFGAVYESLLDLNPEINLNIANKPFHYIGSESRKTTGSFYTHADLVKQLIKTALQPVLKDRLAQAGQSVNHTKDRKQALEDALLKIKVCDPACGSGHFLLGAARALATELAYIRAEEGESTDKYEKLALRDVIEHCIYGVDLNPDAVELCRLVLWTEAHVPGRAMTYLDHKIKCGNSLVGWFGENENLVIPDGAFKPVSGDDKTVAIALRKRNADERKKQLELGFQVTGVGDEWTDSVEKFQQIDALSSNTLDALWEKQRAHEKWENSNELKRKKLIYDIWTYSFFQSYATESDAPVSQHFLREFEENRIDPNHKILKFIWHEARKMGFFHWQLEFPDVFGREEDFRGFDVLLGNPPWEKIQLEEVKFFARRNSEIAHTSNAALRKKMIAGLIEMEPQLHQEFRDAKRAVDGSNKFAVGGGSFKLTGHGRVNTYALFSERLLQLTANRGRAGFIVPTGIATDHTTRHFFTHLVENNHLISLYDFENRDRLFPDVHGSFKSCLMTISGKGLGSDFRANFGFYLYQVSDLNQQQKVFEMSASDFKIINPNTLTCPVFRTTVDADITRRIYHRVPVLWNEVSDESSWKIQLRQMFNMTTASHHFKSRIVLQQEGHKVGSSAATNGSANKMWLPLYEAKYFWHYNHRLSSYDQATKRTDGTRYLEERELKEPNKLSESWYWVPKAEVLRTAENSHIGQSVIQSKWSIGYRVISCGTNERTFVCSLLPEAGFGNSSPLIRSAEGVLKQSALLANMSSLVLDFVCRQKLGGNNLNFFYVKQLPIIPPEKFTNKDLQFIVPRVLELTYTAWDLKAFADDVWQEAGNDLRELIEARWKDNLDAIELPETERPKWAQETDGEFPFYPFRWDTNYRLTIQCELDAYFAWKYELEEEELKYILDPTQSELAGKGFRGETFRVLKDKEQKKYNEFRTYRLVMEAWKRRPWDEPAQVQLRKKATSSTARNYRLAKRMPYAMAHIIDRYSRQPRYARHLGRVKMEKLLHGIEAIVGVDFGRVPIKHDYGPADIQLLDLAQNNASELAYFKTVEERKDKDSYRFRYDKGECFEDAITHFHNEFEHQKGAIDRLLDLFLEFNTADTELRMTLYATWNNLLLQNIPIENDAQLIGEAHTWSKSKEEKFNPDDFIEPLQWLRDNDLVPKGEGKLVTET
jgi:hypothetical protein